MAKLTYEFLTFERARHLHAEAREHDELNSDLAFGMDYVMLTVKFPLLGLVAQLDSRAPDNWNEEQHEILIGWFDELRA